MGRVIADGQTLALGHGDNDDAAVLARRLIDRDVYDERAHRLLGTALTRKAHTAWTESLAELDIAVPPFNE